MGHACGSWLFRYTCHQPATIACSFVVSQACGGGTDYQHSQVSVVVMKGITSGLTQISRLLRNMVMDLLTGAVVEGDDADTTRLREKVMVAFGFLS